MTIVGGMFIDGLYIPPHGFYGFRHLGEDVWGPTTSTKIKRLRMLQDHTSERRALLETLHHRK
jgi:hypothetical protein